METWGGSMEGICLFSSSSSSNIDDNINLDLEEPVESSREGISPCLLAHFNMNII